MLVYSLPDLIQNALFLQVPVYDLLKGLLPLPATLLRRTYIPLPVAVISLPVGNI
jgi:hypothetical protein